MGNDFTTGKVHIELVLPNRAVPEGVVVIPKLPHKSNIVVVETGQEDLSSCDALITGNRSLSLGIKTADCAPICFGDAERIGIAHVGWPGLHLGLIEKMLAHFNADTLSVHVAPFLHIFEIKKDFCYDKLSQKFMKYIEQQSDKLLFHFKDAVGSLLPQAIFDPRSTGTDFSLPSYRRNKTEERLTTIVSFSV